MQDHLPTLNTHRCLEHIKLSLPTLGEVRGPVVHVMRVRQATALLDIFDRSQSAQDDAIRRGCQIPSQNTTKKDSR
jgi:hypothetical protein